MNKDIKSMTKAQIQSEFIPLGLPKYRTTQVYAWLSRSTCQFSDMNNLSKQLRQQLQELYFIPTIVIKRKQQSKVDSTVKYLFELYDGQFIESVVMKYKYGYTICVSTQAGCKMNCDFCATGKGGFFRNLAPSEMLLQVQKALEDLDIRISNIVLMGMGEPFDNYDNVLKFLQLVSSDDGLNVGMRHITISTCGLCDKIIKFTDENLQATLSISLHAPNDNIRNNLMPISKKYPMDELINSCRYYCDKTSKRISFEYAMIYGVNDSENCAYELSSLLRDLSCHVNLIPVNEIRETTYSKSKVNNIKRFKYILEKNNINVTVRRTLGSDIDASCGQLKGKEINY